MSQSAHWLSAGSNIPTESNNERSHRTVQMLPTTFPRRSKSSIAVPWRRLRWIALAFVPSSLMLGVTLYMSVYVAPIPLFWVIPLALYLATFVIVFQRRPIIPHWLVVEVQPIFLDTIGLAFPRLRIIGAHLGYGLYDSAAAVARWRRNVSFDISGGKVVRRHIVERRMIGHEVSASKLVFGSDCDVTHMSREVTAWMDAFEQLGLSDDDQDKIFYRNAAAIFGETSDVDCRASGAAGGAGN